MTEGQLTRANQIQEQLKKLRNTISDIKEDTRALHLQDLGSELFEELKEKALEIKDAEIAKLTFEFNQL